MKMAFRFRGGKFLPGNPSLGSSRRGVTLLLVVTIIVLFLLMGAAFLVLATQFRRSATMLSHVRERRDDAQTLVKRAFQDLLREPSLDNSRSPLRGHSLLGDLYGYGFSLKQVPASAVAVASAIDGTWTVTLTAPYDSLISDLNGQPNSLATSTTFDGRGHLLTLTNFYDAGGVSSGENLCLTGLVSNYEVVPAAPSVPQQYRFTLSFGWDDARRLSAINFATFDLHINGRPFSGTGAGNYTAGGAVTNFRTPALSIEALKPNRSTPDVALTPIRVNGETRTQLLATYLSTSSGPNPDSTNEDYDAVDYQNMFLAAVGYQGGIPQITPSFYRPELVRHWGRPGSPYHSGLATDSLGQFPFSFHADRRNAAGDPVYLDANRNGIPDLNEAGGALAWDVDNDGDGVNDSIWMDIDLPTQTELKGKVYKPLVAYHVLDLDGRLNINFHGNRFQRDPTNADPLLDAGRRALTPHGLFADIGLLHPTGLGLGTGEISLNYALDQTTVNKLLFGFDGVVGRYGSDGQVPPLGNLGSNNGPGAFNLIDWKSRIRFQNYPTDTFATNHGLVNDQLYRSPLDIHGRYEFGVPNVTTTLPVNPYDSAVGTVNIAPGMPIVNATSSTLPNELVDSIYELDASLAPFTPRLGLTPNVVSSPPEDHGLDANYSPHELESVLRVFDFDSRQLPPRLRKFLPDLFSGSNSQLRHLLTTDSWELPVTTQPLAVLLRERWGRAAIQPDPLNNVVGDLPQEVFDGRKLNLNSTLLAPQHLFTLALLVCPEPIDYDYDADGTDDPVADQLAFRKDLAQWCVNVRDFMDPDSVNTRFPYDPSPEDGWTPTLTVWGCERPELLLTESFALHDKRLQDLDSEPSGNFLDPNIPPTQEDFDLDSRLVPNVSAFFELYNPWFYSNDPNTAANSGLPPAELYDAARNGVDLQKLAGGSPVWRLRVLNSSTNTNANIDEQNIDDGNVNVVKIVYFVEPGAGFLSAQHSTNPEIVFYPADGLPAAPPLAPGRRAIVGSSGIAAGGLYTTYIGRRTDLDWNTTRRIVLNPGASLVRTFYWNGTSMVAQDATNVVCLPIGRQYTFNAGVGGSKVRNFGLTDPKRGYDLAVAALGPNYTLNPVADGFEFYDSVNSLPVTFDTPADKLLQEDLDADGVGDRWVSIPTLPSLTGGGLRDEGKIMSCFAVHLQRLANPTQPFDPVNNPYLTVDYIGSDVSIINGVYSGADPDRQVTLNDDLASFERGKFHARLGGNRQRLLWKGTQDGSITVGPPRDAAGADQHIFSKDVIQSFGEVDLAYRQGGSSDAFPWLNWNNRPYTSQLELQYVPYTPQALLTSRFDLIDAPNPDNPYNGASSRVGTGPDSPFPHAADRFNHLFNFYADSVTSGALPTRQGPPALHRLFDYVHVESQFAGAVNRIPGKLNLNTINDERTWLGLMQRFGEPNSPQNPYGGLSWQLFQQSRAGTGALLPTAIANPFRNADAVHRVPLPELLTRTSSASLLRSFEFPQAGGAPGEAPLFDLWHPPSLGLIPRANQVGAWADPERNPYFDYDIRQRLGNLVTNRSNVYAVWITVGFFEIDPTTGKPTTEMGAEDGTAQRHRGFFLVDRSIPVAFEPGRDHDVQNCVLVESIIQREVTSQK